MDSIVQAILSIAKGINGLSIAANNPYKFRVYRSAAQNSTSGAYAVVNFDTRNFDTGSNVDITTNKGRFTAPIAGFYQFSWSAGWVGSTGAGSSHAVTTALYKNGSSVSDGSLASPRDATAISDSRSVGSDVISLAAGDYVEVYIYATATAALGVGSDKCFFSGHLVSVT